MIQVDAPRALPVYLDLAEGETVECRIGERAAGLKIREVGADHATIEIGQQLWHASIGHKGSATEEIPEGSLPQIMSAEGLRVGLDVTRSQRGLNRFSDSHIRLSRDVRVHLSDAGLPLLPDMVFPVEGIKWNRADNWLVKVVYGYHPGIDVYAQRGTPVVASVSGTVVALRRFRSGVDRDDYWGDVAAISDGCGFVYCYWHCDRFERSVEVGAAIESGTVIGSCGRSGFESTNIESHLHFEIYRVENPDDFGFAFEGTTRLLPDNVNGFAVNPYPYLVEAWDRCPGR